MVGSRRGGIVHEVPRLVSASASGSEFTRRLARAQAPGMDGMASASRSERRGGGRLRRAGPFGRLFHGLLGLGVAFAVSWGVCSALAQQADTSSMSTVLGSTTLRGLEHEPS